VAFYFPVGSTRLAYNKARIAYMVGSQTADCWVREDPGPIRANLGLHARRCSTLASSERNMTVHALFPGRPESISCYNGVTPSKRVR